MLAYKEGQTRMNSQQHCSIAGIDVSKATLDIAITGLSEVKHIAYQAKEIKNIITWFKKHEVTLVVIEATGGLEWPVIEQIDAAGVQWHRCNPRQARDFAKAKGQLAKTDKIDARILADYGLTMQLKMHELPCKSRQKLTSWVRRYDQLSKMLMAEKCRLDRCREPGVVGCIKQMIEQLEQQIKYVAMQMQEIIEQDEQMQKDKILLITVPGVGELTSWRLVALLPELGRCNRQQIARLIGVAPINRDSGQHKGKRMTGGGRRDVRRMLYMATIVAMKHNPVIRARYEHLLGKGKAKMVALIACMRKLITLLNTMIRDQKSWEAMMNQG